MRLARDKAAAVAAACRGSIVVAADTAVEIEGTILGKPADAAEAASMLRRLSGRRHEVHTGVAVAVDDSLRTDVFDHRGVVRADLGGDARLVRRHRASRPTKPARTPYKAQAASSSNRCAAA